MTKLSSVTSNLSTAHVMLSNVRAATWKINEQRATK